MNKIIQKLKKLDVLQKLQSTILVGVIAAVLTFPPFLVVDHYTPPLLVAGIRLDQVLVFIALFALIFVFVRKFRLVFYGVMILGLVTITISTLAGGYSLRNLWHDYNSFLFNLSEGAVQFQFDKKNKEFTNEDRLRMAIDYQNEKVRNFAINIAVMHFEEYVSGSNRKVIQCLSVFREIRKRWVYVHDPAFEDYYARASETLKQMEFDNRFKGDCDDYSILMAACIKSIGGEVRLVRTTVKREDGTETGHIYPEVRIGDEKDLEMISYLIKEELFTLESKNKDIFYHQDEAGDIWLNFDYNDYYPGGKYQSAIRDSEIEI
jgi:hypothetical protein